VGNELQVPSRDVDYEKLTCALNCNQVGLTWPTVSPLCPQSRDDAAHRDNIGPRPARVDGQDLVTGVRALAENPLASPFLQVAVGAIRRHVIGANFANETSQGQQFSRVFRHRVGGRAGERLGGEGAGERRHNAPPSARLGPQRGGGRAGELDCLGQPGDQGRSVETYRRQGRPREQHFAVRGERERSAGRAAR
jgi:hypothetical protein